MANRVILGNDGSNFVLKVSQPGDNVLSPSEPLIFDSTGARSGMTFAGGNTSTTTGINWSATKGNLGYIPLVVSMDDAAGTIEEYDFSSSTETYHERVNMTETSTTHIIPAKFGSPNANGAVSSNPRTATNFKFFVLRVPLQYGKMNDASLWS
jgi:hypothetical protein